MANNLHHFLSDAQIILDAVGEGIYGFDLTGKAVFINPAAERITGWRSEELLGKKIHDYHHHSFADGSPYPAEDCKIYNTMKDGISKSVQNEVFWRKDGSSFPVEYTTTPIYREGEIIGAVAVFRDVSQQHADRSSLESALAKVKKLTQQLQAENTYLQQALEDHQSSTGLVGNSLEFQQIAAQIELVGQTDSMVLILGENGTGKELAANSVRNASKRRHKPFVKVNCAAFTESLLESELFGHERGAFTGATERRLGRFEQAHTGTLFLDEIGELSLEAQSKLLRVLQEQSFERVGGSKTIEVDVRIITATNRDLESMVQNGTFRMDLYYRLNVFPITMPPLRAHKQDIPLLCETFIKQLNKKLGKQVIAISNKSLDSLARYDWPGNIRELQNVLEREMILSTRDILSFSFKPQQNLTVDDNLKLSLTEVEKAHIIKVLNHYHWKIGGKNGAAKHLGLPDSTLRSRMDKLNIRRPAPNS